LGPIVSEGPLVKDGKIYTDLQTAKQGWLRAEKAEMGYFLDIVENMIYKGDSGFMDSDQALSTLSLLRSLVALRDHLPNALDHIPDL
jgi:hypothetical protein